MRGLGFGELECAKLVETRAVKVAGVDDFAWAPVRQDAPGKA
jgi:hypothetical protein